MNGQAYSYDGNGNLTSGGGRSYSWTVENQPSSITVGSASETYQYDADGRRVVRVAGGRTTIYVGEVWEEEVGGIARSYVLLNGKAIAFTGWSESTLVGMHYMHSDQIGSVSVLTSGWTLEVYGEQEFDPWGAVRSGGISQTKRNYTGQVRDDTALLYYNARYYDPAIGRFVSADTIIPGNASGSMDGGAVKPLTVGFHETPFLTKLNQENQLGFWFQLSDRERQQAGSPWGPSNPQALNRYSYVQNNPLRYTDPTGHYYDGHKNVSSQ